MNQFKREVQMTVLDSSTGAALGFGHTDSLQVSGKQTLFAVATTSGAEEVLEPYDGKLSSTVLRGDQGRKPLGSTR